MLVFGCLNMKLSKVVFFGAASEVVIVLFFNRHSTGFCFSNKKHGNLISNFYGHIPKTNDQQRPPVHFHPGYTIGEKTRIVLLLYFWSGHLNTIHG